jgi:SAM-dependent methyltransferase
MIEVARATADRENVNNAAFEQADAQIHPFDPQSFDVAISRTGAMFFGDPEAAFTNIARALRRRGRLVLLTWQPLQNNEWMVSIRRALAAGRTLPTPPPDVPGPFSMADPDRVRNLLERVGYSNVRLEALEELISLGPDVETAYDFLLGLAGWMLDGLNDGARSRARAALRETVESHLTDSGVTFGSATWLITAVATNHVRSKMAAMP